MLYTFTVELIITWQPMAHLNDLQIIFRFFVFEFELGAISIFYTDNCNGRVDVCFAWFPFDSILFFFSSNFSPKLINMIFGTCPNSHHINHRMYKNIKRRNQSIPWNLSCSFTHSNGFRFHFRNRMEWYFKCLIK